MSNTQTYGNNNGVELFLVIVGIVIVACLLQFGKQRSH